MATCRFCGGRGCLACPGEEERIETIEPAFIIRKDHFDEDLALVKDILGAEAIDEEFKRGVDHLFRTPEQRIAQKLAIARFCQALDNDDSESLMNQYRDAGIELDKGGSDE
jgi:hypothetical protein